MQIQDGAGRDAEGDAAPTATSSEN
jgi:hypothetical protein